MLLSWHIQRCQKNIGYWTSDKKGEEQKQLFGPQPVKPALPLLTSRREKIQQKKMKREDRETKRRKGKQLWQS